MAEPVVLDR